VPDQASKCRNTAPFWRPWSHAKFKAYFTAGLHELSCSLNRPSDSTVPENAFGRSMHNSITGLLDDKGATIAAFEGSWGRSSVLARFEGKGETPAWQETVWAAGRGITWDVP